MDEKKKDDMPTIEELYKENARLYDQIGKQAKYIRDLEGAVSARERMMFLMSVISKDNKFPTQFNKAVRAEFMYLVNGYDPEGVFKKEEGDVEAEEGKEEEK